MRSIQTASLLLGFGLMVLVLTEREADGRSKRRNRHAHSHGHSHSHKHGHDHGGKEEHGHSHSPFTFGLGLSVSQGFGGSSEKSGSSEESHGHSHSLTGSGKKGFALHEGHSHDSGGEEGASGESGTATEISLTGGYRINKRLSLDLGLAYSPDYGIGDPSFGGTHTMPLKKRLDLATTLSATAPFSEASQESYKTTTVTLTTGPNWSLGRITASLKAKFAKSYYSKTIIVEEEEEGEDGHDHEHTLRNGLSLQEDESEEHLVETAEAGTGDREFDRYGLNGTLGYRLAPQWTLNFGLGVAYVTHQFGETTVETNATVVQGTYTWKSFSGFLGLLTSAQDTSFSIPTQPSISAGIFYLYE